MEQNKKIWNEEGEEEEEQPKIITDLKIELPKKILTKKENNHSNKKRWI